MTVQIRLPAKLLCRAHYHQLVPEHHSSGVSWQTRYTVVAMHLAKIALETDTRLHVQCEQEPAMVSAVLAQRAPLCCYLGQVACAAAAQEVVLAVQRITRQRAQGTNPSGPFNA